MQIALAFDKNNPGQTPCGYKIDSEWQLNYIKMYLCCPKCQHPLSQGQIQPLSNRRFSRLNEIVKFFSKGGSLEYCGAAQAATLGYSFCRFFSSNCSDPIPINCLDGRLLAKSGILICVWFYIASSFSMPKYFQSQLQISNNNRYLINLGTIATTLANQLCLFETSQENHTLVPMVLFDLAVISGYLGLFSHARDLFLHGNADDCSQIFHCFLIFMLNASLIVLINQLFLGHSNNSF